MAIIYLISLRGLISCASKPKEEEVFIYPKIYFPEFPDPEKYVKPLDYNGQLVEDEETDIYFVQMPFWYWLLIVDYKVDVDKAERFYNYLIGYTEIEKPP